MGNTVTDIVVILDRSGSMLGTTDDTIAGYNSFIEEQKNVVGKARLTLVQFDASSFSANLGARPGIETIYSKLPLKSVPPLNRDMYQPYGNTPLYDAIGYTLDNTRLTGKVVVLIITDGYENASTRYSLDKVKKMITERQDKGFRFVFIGADVRTMEMARSFNIPLSSTGIYHGSAIGTRSMYSTVSSSIGGARGQSMNSATLSSIDIPDDIPEEETVTK
jgi:hypothetical protein